MIYEKFVEDTKKNLRSVNDMKIMFGISFCSLKLLSIDLFFKDTLPVNSIIQVAQCTMYVAN